jgi:hypothetical protein
LPGQLFDPSHLFSMFYSFCSRFMFSYLGRYFFASSLRSHGLLPSFYAHFQCFFICIFLIFRTFIVFIPVYFLFFSLNHI